MAKTSRFLQLVFVVVFLSLLDGRFAAPAYCEERIPTDGPCNDSIVKKAKGKWKWHKRGDVMSGSVTSLPQQEAVKRMDEFHKMVAEIYPSPSGVDALWHRTAGSGLFAYKCSFVSYVCASDNKNQMMASSPGSTQIMVSANGNFPWGAALDETWAIDRRPVMRRLPLREMWKGYQMFQSEAGSNTRYVLIHRKGILPYIPVTRKQYLDHSIKHLTEFQDNLINDFRKMPVRPLEAQEAEKKQTLEKYEKAYGKDPKRLKSATDYYLSGYQTDQQRRDEQVNKQIKQKNEVLKRYLDELEKTTREGLLDNPAIVLLMHSPDTTTPIFVTEAENGTMLITENPAYMRKELPNYVPQVLVLYWSWNDWEPQKYINTIMEKNFPVERLQAMIDR